MILAVAALLRLYRLDQYPLPMHQDELSDAYDAWSIVETGADRAGTSRPVIVRALGEVDYRPALNAWITAIPMNVTGFSPVAARIPTAILGIATLALTFLFASLLVSETFGLVALSVAAFNPWHLTYSRFAHQGGMLPAFFSILTLLIWLRAAELATRARSGARYPRAHLAVLGFVLGFSANSYQTTRLIAPLVLLLVAYDVVRYSSRRADILIVIAAAAAGAAPQIFVLLTEPAHFFARLTSTLPESTSDSPSAVQSALKALGLVFNPRLLFWPNMEDTGYLSARLLLAELPFYYLGFLTLARLEPLRLTRFRNYLLAVFGIALIPAIITANSSSIRVTWALPLLPLLTAAGVLWCVRLLARREVPQALSYGVIGAAMTASLAFTAYMYFGSATVNGLRSNNVLVQMGQHLKRYEPRYNRVFVADSPESAALHVAAFSGMPPSLFQKSKKATVNERGWDYITAIGKYRFVSPTALDSIVKKACKERGAELFVGRSRPTVSTSFDSVQWHDEKYYFFDLSADPRCI